MPLPKWIGRVLCSIGLRATRDDTVEPKAVTVDEEHTSPAALSFDPDRPIQTGGEDRLGFSNIAKNLAKSVASSSAKEGFVIGIEGQWGSGKSSILNLLSDELRSTPNVSVLRFDPWIIGDRDAMVASLIGDLATRIDELEANSKGMLGKAKEQAVGLASELRVYGATASRGLSRLAKLASSIGMPGEPFSSGLDEVTKILEGKAKPAPISVQRKKLFEGLRKFGHRFVVVIDDLDRLEPSEAAEVIRLIRAVGDFPNVVYLLCYDKDVLAKSLESAIEIDDGIAFLRKIVQVSFLVPRPEEFDLRRWLLAECSLLFEAVNGRVLPGGNQTDRLTEVCDKEGSLLRTPREIALVLNALRLVYPPVADQVDFSDMCWLQTVRILNEPLYKWTEEYLGLFAVVIEQYGHVGDDEKKALTERLSALMPEEGVLSARSLWRVKEIIPGIEEGLGNKDELNVLGAIGKSERAALEADKRLGSSQHFRYYFSFSEPSGALSDGTVERFINLAGRNEDLNQALLSLINARRPQGGTMYGVLLDRIARVRPTDISLPAMRQLMIGIGDTVDTAEQAEPRGGPFGLRMNWKHAQDAFQLTLSLVDEASRQQFLSETFADRKSIGWLLERLIGRELFSHGRAGDRAVSENERMLTPSELDMVIKTMFDRLAGPDRSRIANVPELLGFLYRWMQAGGEADAKRWVAEQSVTDEGLVRLLDAMRGWRATSSGVSHPLLRRDVSHFMDFGETIRRLEAVSANAGLSEHLRSKASELLEATQLADSDIGQ